MLFATEPSSVVYWLVGFGVLLTLAPFFDQQNFKPRRDILHLGGDAYRRRSL